MSTTPNGGALLTYQPYPYLYYPFGPYVPAHSMMYFGEINRNLDTRFQYSGDIHAMSRDTSKERMGPPLYFQSQSLPRSLHGLKKGPYWTSKRFVKGSQGQNTMSPANSECESDDSGRSSTTSTTTSICDIRGSKRHNEVDPIHITYNQYPHALDGHDTGASLHQQTVFFHNKRRYDGSRASSRTYRQIPTNQHYQQPHHHFIAPDRFMSKSHLIEVKESPTGLVTGSKWDKLSQDIWDKFMSCQQTEDTFKKKMTLWRFLYVSIKNVFPRYSLYLVGSTASGYGSNSSDMDLCLLVRSQESVDNRAQALMHLDTILRFIKTLDVFMHAEMIRAKVPILKFRDSCFSLEVDLNCNNVVGIRNTHLLYCYSQMDWRVRPLVLIIKLWAQHNHINDPKNKSISSYSLALMVIHFLQYGVLPAVLPCLQEMYPEKFSPDRDIHQIDMFEQMSSYDSKNKQTIGELLLGFLKYYAKFEYSQKTISVRTGSYVSIDKSRLQRRHEPHQWKLLCVEEPFDLSNTARSVYDEEVFSHIVKVFEYAANSLEKNPSLTTLLPP